MISNILLISLLPVVNAQHRLASVPDACSGPKSPPTCMFSTATPYFKSCGVYNGGDCPRFCYDLQAQYRTRQSSPLRYFRFAPSQIVRKRIHSFCMFRCAYAKKRIRHYRFEGLKKIENSTTIVFWEATNVKALIHLSVNQPGFVTSRVLAYTTNARVRCFRNQDGTKSCFNLRSFEFNGCTCSACTQYRASCPRCCRSAGHIWV